MSFPTQPFHSTGHEDRHVERPPDAAFLLWPCWRLKPGPPISRRTPERQVKLRWFKLNAAEGRRVFVCLLTRLKQLHLTSVLHVTDPPPAILQYESEQPCWYVSALLLLITKSILVENGAFWREFQPAPKKKKNAQSIPDVSHQNDHKMRKK